MHDNLRKHLDTLFNQMPQTLRAQELKEEMLQNLTEKYNDLINEGKSPEEAYSIAVASIGDIGALFEFNNAYPPMQDPKQKRKSALLTSIAVALYILCIIPPMIFGMTSNSPELGAVFMFLMIAIATALLIYNQATKPKYVKADETIVEEFKEWQSTNNYKTPAQKTFRAFTGAYWCLVTAVYFVLSFFTSAWYVTWVIFIIAVAIHRIISICLSFKEGDR